MKEYLPLAVLNLIELQETANKLMLEGWVPIGGMSISFLPNFHLGESVSKDVTVYCQAFIRG